MTLQVDCQLWSVEYLENSLLFHFIASQIGRKVLKELFKTGLLEQQMITNTYLIHVYYLD